MVRSLDYLSLYLMQNEVGLIKIGRSANPGRRRSELSKAERCSVALLHVWPGAGGEEEAVHVALDDHRVGGEWFDGTDEARAAIVSQLGLAADLNWPFAFNADAAEQWLDTFFDRFYDRSIQRLITRAYRTVREATQADSYVRTNLWILHRLLAGEDITVLVSERDREGRCRETTWIDGKKVVLPDYLNSVEAALTLWPDDGRPEAWDGSALECCKAAMELRQQQWVALRRAMQRVD